MSNEKLIEEAAATIAVADLVRTHRTWGDLLEPQKDEYRRVARAALAVFEKAHTPTDDEREALAKVIDDAADAAVSPERMRSSLTMWLADAILAAGFRRPEVPESNAPLRDHLGWDMSLQVKPEPQGEACMVEHPISGSRCSLPTKPRHAHVCDLPPAKPLGEPSDAQRTVPVVNLDAISADLSTFPFDGLPQRHAREVVEDLRATRAELAALRAAGGVR